MLKHIVMSSFVLVVACACEIAKPFQGPKWDPNTGLTDATLTGPFIAATTEVILKNDSAAHDLFDADMDAIQAELKDAPGLIGYSLSFVVGGNDYRTLSVWENEEAMLSFVTGDAHGKAIGDADALGEHGAVTHWSIEKDELPPTFDDAKRELEKSGRTVVGE